MITELICRNSERQSELKRPYQISRKLKIRCVLFGLSFGLIGLAWILTTHEIPLPAIYYHLPLAFVFGAWLAVVDNEFLEHNSYNLIVVTFFSLLFVAGRTFLKWPISGHGILGALIAVLGLWSWLRLFATAILLQAFLTKIVIGAEPLSVVYGGLVGLALAELTLVKIYFNKKAKK